MKAQDVMCLADTNKRQTLGSAQTKFDLWCFKSSYQMIIS